MTLLYRTATILLLALLAAGVDSLVRPIRTRPAAPVAPQPTPTPNGTSSTPTGTTPPIATPSPVELELDITVAQSHDLFQKGATFIDARSRADYEAGHVAGAFHIPVEAFAGNAVPEAAKFFDGHGPVVVYCTGGDCHASHDVVIRLQDLGTNLGLGFAQCYVLKDGYPAWQAAGHPIEAGPGPLGATP